MQLSGAQTFRQRPTWVSSECGSSSTKIPIDTSSVALKKAKLHQLKLTRAPTQYTQKVNGPYILSNDRIPMHTSACSNCALTLILK